ncbi:MAG: DUF433 domain-containing protein [Rubrobacter sp.]|nr:DUF433 domain-containing protein [Rubrobacter sp.]
MDRVEISDLRSSPQDCGIILPPRVQKGGRSVETRQIVSRNPNVLNGELVFAGTRVPVKNLVDYLAAGDPLEEFLEGFPGVSREQAVAYLEMAREAAEEYSRESAAG